MLQPTHRDVTAMSQRKKKVPMWFLSHINYHDVLKRQNLHDSVKWFCRQQRKGCWWKTYTKLQTKNLIQEKCHQEGRKLQLSGWVFCGICTDIAAVRVSAIRVEFYKAYIGCHYIISDPRLELRHSGIDFWDVGQGTRYSKTGNASLDPHWALLALQRSTRVTLQKETEWVNETATDMQRPASLIRDERITFVSFNVLVV